MADHTWVNENLDTYLAGNLTTAERESVEQHVAACDECKQALAEARRLERLLSGLFIDARPVVNLDECIIHAIGQEPMRGARRRPRAWRFFVAAAAVLIVGLVGYIIQAMSLLSEVQMEHTRRVAMNSSPKLNKDKLRNVADAGTTKSIVAELEEELKASGNRINARALETDHKNIDGLAGYSQSAKLMPDTDGPQLNKFNGSAGPKPMASSGSGGMPGKPSDGREKFGGAGGQKGMPLQGAFYGRSGATGSAVVDESRRFYGSNDFGENKKDVSRDKAEFIVNNSGSRDSFFTTKPVMPGFLGGMGMATPTLPQMFFTPNQGQMLGNQAQGGQMMGAGGSGGAGLMGGGMMGMPTGDGAGLGMIGAGPPLGPKTPPAEAVKASKYFAQSSDPAAGETARTARGIALLKPAQEQPAEPKAVKAETDIQSDKGDKKPPQPEPPIETNRKIIRTGEMEFEIESFDKSVENVTRLITAVKGGFVATINSDKLANGKMRGSIVVRMPPQYLDQFVLELRRELAKSGELKNQRIVSLDVTKQYTDIESRLRASRAIEERLINIIKTGKGEIKDLVAAEKELGVWRTKIEEMEGEIRYYGNQVALSTLTITLNEKEILAPTAIVVTENVRMRLEVEDVAKAHQIAMTAVEEVKGRITKSELKQHSAGQLQSILHADIPPAKKDAFRDKLKKLGILSDHQENQQQHTEGGVGKGPELKPRLDDVRFEVTMHNTANVRPRLTADLKVATSDVPAAYARLIEEIAKLKGQVRDGKLNEQDKLNVTAFLDFNVPTTEKPTLDKLLLDIGPVLERVNVLAPVNELSTSQKFGYTLHLRDFTSIAPSKAVAEVIAVNDVPAVYAKLQEALAKAKAQFIQASINEQDKLNVFAQLDFTVLSEEKPAIDKLLVELGTSLSHTNVQTPLNQLSTPRKFGYSLMLRNIIGVPPTKATELKVATTDVPTNYAKIIDAVAKAKGRVSDSKFNEQDKLHITAHIAFTVPTEEKATFDKLLVEIGTVLSRNNVQAPVNQLSTAKKFGYALDLRDFATIPPSQASIVTIAASKVPDNYAKLMDAIAKAKGQVRDGKLNEQDKLNVTGQIDFTVPSEQKAAIEKLLAEMGTMLSRKNDQAPVTELSTDGKFGYAVVLRDFANIPARETFIVQLALTDVPTSFREFQDAVGLAKGWVSVGKLVEDNKAKIEAQIDFDVPAAERPAIEKLLAKTGAVLSRTGSQASVNDLATDRKVGYRVSLHSAGNIPPREKTLIKFEVADVKAKAEELKQLVVAGQGKIIDSTFDKYENGQASAVLVFEVPFASQAALVRQMGEPLSQRTAPNTHVPVNALTTAQIIVTLAGGTPIVPDDKGIGTYVRTSLNLSFQILATIVMTLIVGLSAVLPCVILLWIGFKLYLVMFGAGQGSKVIPTASSQLATDGGQSAEGDPTAKP